MANLPQLRSREQIIGELINGFLARVKDVNDLNRGSVISQFFQAVGQSNFKAAANVITMIDALSVDRAEGEALQRLAADADVTVSPGSYASGRVNITDLSFKKISTNVFAGQPAPVAGSTKIFVVDASKFNAGGGKVYVGRGTPNVEGPLQFISAQSEGGGAYWSITLDPSSPTTKFHNIGEGVVVAQGGNRKINSGTTVKTASGSGVTSVDFKTVSPGTIPDGEVEVTDIPVVANVIGPKGNVPRGSIREAVGLTFTATVFNNNAFVTGIAPDDEDAIRTKIKDAEQAKSKGTEQAIKASAIGVVSDDDLKKVQSSNVLRASDSSAALIFDDGTGYEPIFKGVGLEQVTDDALGGERELQLRKRPVTSARVKSIELAPFKIINNSALSVSVQGETTTHFFASGDFRVPSSATAYEVISSINGNPNINFLAATADGGSKVVLYPRDRKKNDITVNRLSSNDANDSLGFQTTTQYTLLLYKNDKILYQDGLQAVVTTRLKSAWSTSIAEGDTLSYVVDNTPEIEITLTKETFQEFDLTSTVNAFTPINIWVKVFNRLMSGVIATISGEEINFTSARGENNNANIEITGGTLKDKIFETGIAIAAEGRESDYTLNRQTGQIGLTNGLQPGDKISAGSSFTRANINTTQLPDGPSSNGNIWIVVDGGVKLFPSGLEGNTITTFSKSGTKITIESKTPNFDPVAYDEIQVGDWCIVWPEQTDAANYPILFSYQGFWRVESVQRGKIVVDDGIVVRGLTGSATLPTDRIAFVRSEAPIQKLSFTVGPLSQFVAQIEDNLEGVNAEVIGSTIRISTITANSSGELVIIAADSQGKALGISVGDIIQNIPSQKGFVVTEDSEVGMPSFSFSSLSTYIADDQFLEPKYQEIGGTVDDFIEILNRYQITPEHLVELPDSNKSRRMFVKEYNPSTSELLIDPKTFSETPASVLKENDRYFLRTSYQFDSTDTTTAIVDGDTTTKIFGLPVARKLVINSHSTPTLNDFSASDGESSLDISDTSSFAGFDFRDWKVWRQASTVLTDGSTYGVRVKSADHGPAGDTIRVGFVYPKNINTDALDLVINNASMIDMGIIIPVTTVRTPNWDGTTSFTTDIERIVATGKDKVTYRWRSGSEPNFLAAFGGAAVAIGDLVIINSATDFLPENKDIEAKVVDVSATTFAIEIPTGIAISDNIIIQSAQNINGKYTVTTPQPHRIEKGDRVGLWDTALADGIVAPLDGAYFATIINDNTFSINVNPNVPGGTLSTATHTSNLVICETPQLHNLNEGNIIIVSGFATGNYNGSAVVLEVLTPNKFSYIREGSSSGAINGRFDFQSMGPDFTVEFASLDKVGGTVTVTTTADHNLTSGSTVQISGADIATFGGNNEIQSLANDKVPSSGSFTLNVNGNNTAPLPFNASPGAVEAALNTAYPSTGIRVEGGLTQGGFAVIFEGDVGNLPHIPITIPVNTLQTNTGRNTVNFLNFNALPSMGTYRLKHGLNTTAVINPLLGNAILQSALEALPSIGAGNVSVTGDFASGYYIEFIGALSNTDVPKLVQNSTELLTVAPISSYVQATNSSTFGGANEIHTLSFSRLPSDGYYRLELNGQRTVRLSYNVGSADIQTAIGNLAAIGIGNVSVTGNPTNGFLIEFIGTKANQAIGGITVVVDIDWNIGTNYAIGDTVRFENENYISLQAGNIGNYPGTSPGFWTKLWQPLIGFSVGGATILVRTDDTTFKFANASLYNTTAVGDIVEFSSGALIGKRFQVTAKSQIPSDPAFNFSTTHTISVNSTIVENINNSNFSIKKKADIVATKNISGFPVEVLPASNRIKVTTSMFNAAKAGDRIRITSGLDSGTIYEVTDKENVSPTVKELIVKPNVSVNLNINDTFEIRRLVSAYVIPFEGKPNEAVTLIAATALDGVLSASYDTGDLVEYLGNTYEALIDGATGNPDITPSEWIITDKELNGTYVVSTVNSATEFEYAHYHTIGNNSTQTGTVTKLKAHAKLARSLGKSASVLAFGEVGTTAQEVVDYLAQDRSDVLQGIIEFPYLGIEAINTSTKDNDIATGFLIGNAIEIKTTKASRAIDVKVDAFVKEGSTITLESSSNPEYDGTYPVFNQRQDGLNWIITLQSKIFATATVIYALTDGIYQGATDYVTLRDGENSVKSDDLQSLIGDPQFLVKTPWNLIPTIGEEVRLIACNTAQLTEFWNRLVVTGISNVTSVENSEYGRQIQLTTDKFGSEGSIQFTGGTANNSSVAIIGSGSELDDKVGVFTIPYELRRGLTRKSWIKMEQTVRLNKETQFEGDSVIRVYPDGIEILNATPGTFQTQRATTHDETSIFRVEAHGKFTAIINIGGQDIGLDVANVEEGDWVRFTNKASPAYDVLTNYGAGSRVLFAGLNWTAIRASGPATTVVSPIPSAEWSIDAEYYTNNTVTYNGKSYIYTGIPPISGQYPDDPASDWDLQWEVQEWAGGNTGIFKVVRVFGSNAFWIENANVVEGMSKLGNADNLTFYSHDSVMPGDTFVISGNILGAANAGRYTVRDETFGVGYFFPTETRIWTDPITLASGAGGITLGDSFPQVNVEEKDPLRTWKRILAVGPGESGLANIIVDSPNLMNKLSSSNAAFIEAQGKIGYDTVPAFGIDAYKHFGGLIRELNRVIYGDPTSPAEYPGVRAAGTDIDIKEAIIKRIKIALSVRVRTGISFADVRESIKAAVAGYVNNLGTGQQVALSKVVEAASKVNGVASVVVTFPTYNVGMDQIPVGAEERASIVDPTFDVTVAILGT